MKKIRDKIEQHILLADRKWKELSAKRQRLLTKLFFAGYALITVIVIISIFISRETKSDTILIDHSSGISNLNTVKKVANDNQESPPNKKLTYKRTR